MGSCCIQVIHCAAIISCPSSSSSAAAAFVRPSRQRQHDLFGSSSSSWISRKRPRSDRTTITYDSKWLSPNSISSQRRSSSSSVIRSKSSLSSALFASRTSGDDQASSEVVAEQQQQQHPRFNVLDGIERIYCLSDLHVDHDANMEWLEQKLQQSPTLLSKTDCLIVAGDISHDMERLERTFHILKRNGCESIVFLPGNHEAWLSKADRHRGRRRDDAYNYTTTTTTEEEEEEEEHTKTPTTTTVFSEAGQVKDEHMETTTNTIPSNPVAPPSLTKLDRLYAKCRRDWNVLVDPTLIYSTEYPVWLVPLQSWYDGSLSVVESSCPEYAEELLSDFAYWPWADFRRCDWGTSFSPAEAAASQQQLLGQPSSSSSLLLLARPSAEDDESTTKDKDDGTSQTSTSTMDNNNNNNNPQQQQQPNNARIPMGLAQYFHERNRPNLELVRSKMNNPSSSSSWLMSSSSNTPSISSSSISSSSSSSPSIITISHFLPNMLCLPDWKDLDAKTFDCTWMDHGGAGTSAKFAKVAGSLDLDQQIRSLLLPDENENDDNDNDDVPSERQRRRHLHVFGHSHRPKDFEWKGIRYIHNPLGSPRERLLYMVSPEVDFQCIWTTNHHNMTEHNNDSDGSGSGGGGGGGGGGGEVPRSTTEPILRLWEEQGGGMEGLQQRLALYGRKARLQRAREKREANK